MELVGADCWELELRLLTVLSDIHRADLCDL